MVYIGRHEAPAQDPTPQLGVRLTSDPPADGILCRKHGHSLFARRYGGRFVEKGTHDELHTLGGRDARLHEQQQRAARNRYVNPREKLPA